MNKWQVKVLNECPGLYRPTLERAYAGKSRNAAIRAFCLRCVGFMRNEVRDCTSFACPLHPYRPYQVENDPEDEAE
jgi:hypothetical protein